MKDAFLQKVKPMSSCPVDTSEPSEKSTNNNEAQRRVRHSAAMLGLAISMGATGMFFPSQEDQALAADAATIEAQLTNVQSDAPESLSSAKLVHPTPVETEESTSALELSAPIKSVPSSEEVKESQEVAAAPVVVTEPAPPVIKHKVKAGETVWELSQDYAVKPEAIAASNKLESKSNLQVGQTLKIPAISESTPETPQLQAAVTPTQESAEVVEPIVLPGVPELNQAQETALSSIKKNPAKDLKELSSQESKLNQPEIAEQTEANPSPIALSPEKEGDLSQQPVSIPQTAAIPLPEPQENLDFQQPIPIPVPIPETPGTTSRTEQPASSGEQLNPVPLLPTPGVAPSREATVSPNLNPGANSTLGNSIAPQPNTVANFNQPIAIPVPPPETGKTPSSQTLENLVTLPSTGMENPSTTNSNPIPVEVQLPQQIASRPSTPVYQVRRGDTLDSIARRYGISRSDLARANNIRNPNLIKVNQNLVIPGQPVIANNAQPVTLIPGMNINAPTTVAVAPTVETPVGSNSRADRLRNDLERLRQDYQPQREESSPVASNSGNGLSAFNEPIPIPVEMNPEWQNSRSNQPGLPNYRQSQLQTPVQTQARPQVVAVAPAPPEAYNGMLQTPVGEMVSPDLPPLSSPDNYLPNSPARFNGYIWPAKGVLTSGYGRRWGRMHKGIDIAAPVGTPIMAAAAGEVISAGWNSGGYGNLVKLKHADGSITFYAHNNRILVRTGQYVEQGQQISEMGSTGFSTGPHLHFEVHPGGQGAVNPIAYLPKR